MGGKFPCISRALPLQPSESALQYSESSAIATEFHLCHFSTKAYSCIFYQSEYWRKCNDKLGAFMWAFKDTKHSDRTTLF